MPSNFQSSFIPKDSATENVFKKKKAGIIGILVVSAFIFSVIVSVGAVLYKNIVNGDIETLQLKLVAAEGEIDNKTIDEMLKFSKKLEVVRSIVLKHQVVSSFMTELSSSTVSTVYFKSFQYGTLEKDGLYVTMDGTANSYASIALQEDVFLKNKNFKSVEFSELSLAEKGEVSFKVYLTVDPSIIVYNPPVSQTKATSTSTQASKNTTEIENDEDLTAFINDIDLDIDLGGL